MIWLILLGLVGGVVAAGVAEARANRRYAEAEAAYIEGDCDVDCGDICGGDFDCGGE